MGAAAMTGIVGSAIGAGSSLIGGATSTAMQNKANKDIAQMNNAFNEKMLDKQMNYNKEMYQQQLGDQWQFYDDAKENSWKLVENQQQYQTDMWNKTNEYNSPAAQRQRLESAGLNPYLMMNGGSAGVAQSASGSAGTVPSGAAPSAQGINPPTATPYSADYSGLMQGLGQAIDTLMGSSRRRVENANADNLRIEGKYIASKALAQILQMRTEAKTKEARLALDKLVASFDMDLKSAQAQQSRESAAQSRAQTRLLITENLMRRKELDFLPQAQKMQLAQSAADVAYRWSQKQLTDKQVAHEIEKIAETQARTGLTNQQYWTERANTVNAQLDNTGKQLENQYNSETYKARVKTISVTLQKLINEDLPFSLKELFIRPTKKFDLFK